MKKLNGSFARILILFSFLVGGCGPLRNVPSPQLLVQDREARQFVDDKKIEEALDAYSQMLEEASADPTVHSNIGASLYSLTKKEEALKSLEHALELAKKNNDRLAEFAIQYNLGVYYGPAQPEKALEHYQAALQIVPWHVETRHNIELLFQQKNQGGQSGDQSEKKDQQQSGGGGQGQQQNKDQQQQQPQDQKDDQNKNQNDQDKQDQQNEKQPKQQKTSPKYKPRPYQGEKLSEGDVNKILGELKNQEQKIRSHFDKKEKKDSRNEKDW